MDKGAMIPCVKWARKGFAAEYPVSPNDLNDAETEESMKMDLDNYNFSGYDQEDSINN